MDLKKDVIPMAELKTRTNQILERVMKTGEPILVTKKGHSAVLIVDVQSFQKQQRKLQILETVVCGEKEILDGKGISHAQIKTEVARWSLDEK